MSHYVLSKQLYLISQCLSLDNLEIPAFWDFPMELMFFFFLLLFMKLVNFIHPAVMRKEKLESN